ncbi:hypothetical protein MBEHAL_0329 [Halarchaeum acidiphilum MH1-52-1]|uniref:Uncharacterized protein n=1 Tax=Halarchaeum acidiphilum MH1-52-1 TaxID=1261545 RepID=U3A1P2_9EURY|nr:hypothetical protein MBEHAL_0329 [Halarchaeum acidiphilum MH1-52-1]
MRGTLAGTRKRHRSALASVGRSENSLGSWLIIGNYFV